MPSFPDYGNRHMAAYVANNLVTQVLDEAQDIVNAANDSGQSWRYIWNEKKGKGEFCENAELLGNIDNKNESNYANDSCIKQNDNVITSTPQKGTAIGTNSYSEGTLIGQGDEDLELRNVDLRASTSMLINNLFDMSEMEHVACLDVTEEEDMKNKSESREFLVKTLSSLVESYINSALNTVRDDPLNLELPVSPNIDEKSGNSSYSLLSDALGSHIVENVTFYIDNENDYLDSQKTRKLDCTNEKDNAKKDIDLYEKAYSTLNRDDDGCSENEESVLQDRKCFTLEDVDLILKISPEKPVVHSEPVQISQPKEGGLMKSASVTGTHKHSLVRRCRMQGVRLLARWRSWWWKQGFVGKRKQSRASGLCPMSPVARSRAASLIDRKHRALSPSHPVLWKFNTVNERLVDSYNRNDTSLK